MFTKFSKIFVLYCKNSSIHGMSHLVNSKSSKYERILWSFVLIIMLSSTIYIMQLMWKQFLDYPITITLESTKHPIQKIPFPGISVCNINKISKKRAENFAKYLSKQSNFSKTVLVSNLEQLGKLYGHYDVNRKNAQYLQVLLEKYDKISGKGEHSIVNLLKMLTTPCNELLKKCMWMNMKINCSDLFLLKETYEGYCCSLNREKYIENSRTENFKNKRSIHTNLESRGLTLEVFNNVSDYVYPFLETVGVNVLITLPPDFPDPTSGSFDHATISTNIEAHIKLNGLSISSSSEIRKYSVKKRNCLFPDEKNTSFGPYSYSDCLVDCKSKSILALCNCLPIITPNNMNSTVCSLADLPCLHKYSAKWQAYYPFNIKNGELQAERENSLNCKECVPNCEDIQYSITYEFLKHLTSRRSDMSKIYIYFDKELMYSYKRNIVYHWFEIISSYGGLFGIFLGASWISVLEIIYYFTIKIFTYKQ